jgi:hypothetical protein
MCRILAAFQSTGADNLGSIGITVGIRTISNYPSNSINAQRHAHGRWCAGVRIHTVPVKALPSSPIANDSYRPE